MNRSQTVDTLLARKLSAILRTQDEDTARAAMHAAVEGGFRVVEFTLTTPGAYRLIREFAANPDLVVGAGTVLTVDDARRAVDAGARFLVSPVWDPEVVAEASRLEAASIPGTFTPTEMLAAHRGGADFVKVFPAPADLPAFVQQVRGPLPQLRLFPTAGVTPGNFLEVLAAGASGVGFVASLFTPQALAAGDGAAIQNTAREIHRAFEAHPAP